MNKYKMQNPVAERNLLCSQKGDDKKFPITVVVGLPFKVHERDVDFPIEDTMYGCRVEVIGLDVSGTEYYGMDSIQAINLATDISPFLRRYTHKYDFFWETGEPYLDE